MVAAPDVQGCGSRVDMMVSMIPPQVHLTGSRWTGPSYSSYNSCRIEAHAPFYWCPLLRALRALTLPLGDYLLVGADYILSLITQTHCRLVCELHP